MSSILKVGGDSKEKKINITTMLQNKIINIFQHRTSGRRVYSWASRGEHILFYPAIFFSHELFLIYIKQNKNKTKQKNPILSPNDLIKMKHLLWEKPVLT